MLHPDPDRDTLYRGVLKVWTDAGGTLDIPSHVPPQFAKTRGNVVKFLLLTINLALDASGEQRLSARDAIEIVRRYKRETKQ